ncbi:hypothetical protein SNEBB_007979 [Seison nebaliae]|nr:hypothetical protein SNEBB_007979 [Seison nebaliae]
MNHVIQNTSNNLNSNFLEDAVLHFQKKFDLSNETAQYVYDQAKTCRDSRPLIIMKIEYLSLLRKSASYMFLMRTKYIPNLDRELGRVMQKYASERIDERLRKDMERMRKIQLHTRNNEFNYFTLCYFCDNYIWNNPLYQELVPKHLPMNPSLFNFYKKFITRFRFLHKTLFPNDEKRLAEPFTQIVRSIKHEPVNELPNEETYQSCPHHFLRPSPHLSTKPFIHKSSEQPPQPPKISEAEKIRQTITKNLESYSINLENFAKISLNIPTKQSLDQSDLDNVTSAADNESTLLYENGQTFTSGQNDFKEMNNRSNNTLEDFMETNDRNKNERQLEYDLKAIGIFYPSYLVDTSELKEKRIVVINNSESVILPKVPHLTIRLPCGKGIPQILIRSKDYSSPFLRKLYMLLGNIFNVVELDNCITDHEEYKTDIQGEWCNLEEWDKFNGLGLHLFGERKRHVVDTKWSMLEIIERWRTIILNLAIECSFDESDSKIWDNNSYLFG